MNIVIQDERKYKLMLEGLKVSVVLNDGTKIDNLMVDYFKDNKAHMIVLYEDNSIGYKTIDLDYIDKIIIK